MKHTPKAARRRVLCGLLSALVLPLAGCGSAIRAAPPAGPAGDGRETVNEAEYRIQVGDQLDVKFFYNPELNEQVIVRPDGRISLQLIPEIVVTDMTPAGLTKRLTDDYSRDLKQPQVTVIVRAFGSQRVFVDGEVGQPGMIPILGLMTALQAISEAGGMKGTAREAEVIVIRRGAANKPLVFPINLEAARDGTDLAQDVSLAPFDIVYVPRSRIANVNKWMDQYIRQNIPIPFSTQYGVYR